MKFRPTYNRLKYINVASSAEQLLPSACPSIQYRLRKEVLGDSPASPRMCDLQNQILEDESVKKVAISQNPDGWLAWNLHGSHSMESDIRLLCEKGVEADQAVLARALLTLHKKSDRLNRGLGKAGKILDDLSFGGGEIIRAALFARAGNEELAFMEQQVQATLDVFKFAAQVNLLEEICQQDKGRFIFRNNVCWPSIYHLRLLAWTQNWRTSKNCITIVESIRNIVRFSPIPDIYVKYKSQVIAPASFCMHHFAPDMDILSGSEWMQWFHLMELLSRLGVVKQIPELKQQVLFLKRMLKENHGMFTKEINHSYFHKWSPYTGLALEQDWRSAHRRVNDLTFRSLLILHYSSL